MTVSCTDEDGGNASVRYEIAIQEDSRAAFDMYWNQSCSKGFSGSWALKGDSLVLDADVCYKGTARGAGSSRAMPATAIINRAMGLFPPSSQGRFAAFLPL